MKQLLMWVLFLLWSLVLIYSTYDNTVKHASVASVPGGYEITYGNTGEVHFYRD